MKRIWKADGADGCVVMCTYFTPPKCTPKNGEDGKFYFMYSLPQLKRNIEPKISVTMTMNSLQSK